jgi:hypothetical protein
VVLRTLCPRPIYGKPRAEFGEPQGGNGEVSGARRVGCVLHPRVLDFWSSLILSSATTPFPITGALHHPMGQAGCLSARVKWRIDQRIGQRVIGALVLV